jgi:monoamine oxidase
MKKLSRRELLRAGGVALAAGMLPSRTASATPQAVQVAVIGGGLAGLTTARELVRRGIGNLVVLEGAERVGGRTLNLPLPGGHIVEGGGEWIGPGQDRIAAIGAELGVTTFDAYYEGDPIYEVQGVVTRGAFPELRLKHGVEFVRLAWRLERMAQALPFGEPWKAPDAAALDAITLAGWLEREGASPWTIETFRIITRAIFSGYPERVSLLWFLFYLKSGGGLLPVIENDGGLQDLRFAGGSQLVSIRAAEALGQRVRLGEPVLALSGYGQGPVEIRTRKATYTADRVVVAMSPADSLRIDFQGGLSPQRLGLVQRWGQLTRLPLIKHSLVYAQPFWRAGGLSGNVMTDRAPIQLIFDNSPEDASIGVLTCFLSPTEAPALAALDARTKLIPQEVARYFGLEAREPVAQVEKDWATDPWSIGCITPLPPGLLSAHGPALREPVGRLHWAGTESAEQGNGYMDGAVRSGERAAAEVAAALG